MAQARSRGAKAPSIANRHWPAGETRISSQPRHWGDPAGRRSADLSPIAKSVPFTLQRNAFEMIEVFCGNSGLPWDSLHRQSAR
jgi:hypothetical protein